MDLGWSVSTSPNQEQRVERTVTGRIKRWGPFYYGSFTYLDLAGGRVSFVGIRRTSIGFSW